MAFLLDDILLAPLNGVIFLAEKIHAQAMEELLDEDGVRQELRDIYMLLETGKMSDAEFEEREAVLVERLEELEAYKQGKGNV
jgi:beta-phosphoglucomutase-like phosphatase (HAD superfamily)